MPFLTADLIITNDGPPIPNGVIHIEQSGEIIEISTDHSDRDVQYHKGLLIPGYINAHCHLELSHLKGALPTGTGLIPFIKGVVGLRNYPQEEIDDAIARAEKEMVTNGIMAVGDISNQSDTAEIKNRSSMRFYTFVELFDFLQDPDAQQLYEDHIKVYDSFDCTGGFHKKSFVPHAPYSVSRSLFKLINQVNDPGGTVSIHNQELNSENQLFQDKSGGFLAFYESFGISLDQFEPINKNSIHYVIEHLSSDFRTLLVHNTCTIKEDIAFAHAWNQQTYWVTCPNANLYIENRLPDYNNFIDSDARVCIGTDSLSSNWSLSIFEEMKTIKKYQSSIDDYQIIKWATKNGADALGFHDLGRLSPGFKPGIIHVDVDVHDDRFDLSKARSSIRIL